MIEVTKNLWVGTGIDAELVMADPNWRDQWFVVSAARDPWHRDALGYTTRGAPKNDPEYLIARRPGHLILNLFDAEDVSYINPTIVDAALEAITENITERKILVHCNKGNSRGPTIAMLWLIQMGVLVVEDHADAVIKFTELYPDYAPARGMNEYAKLIIEGAL